jgi:hypothetical protein
VTFRDVLRGIDAIAFTTLEPGFVFGFTDHTFRIDNITVARTIVPLAGDVDGNGAIDATDLSLLLEAWGSCPPKGACARRHLQPNPPKKVISLRRLFAWPSTSIA